MSVHYKFKNTINYDSVKFDGFYISAADLKAIIAGQKKLGNSELQVENEQTGQLYTDDQLIQKNTNIIVSRLPFANSNKRTRQLASQPYPTRFSGNVSSGVANSNGGNHHHNHNSHHNNNHHHNNRHTNNSSTSSSAMMNPSSNNSLSGAGADGGGREALELVSTKSMSEEEKIKYIQSQSTKDFDPTRYARSGRGGGAGGRGGPRSHFVPPGYTCRKCGIPGHLINDCKSSAMHKVKRSSGIPRDFLMKVDSKEKGALMTPSGEYAVPYIDREAYNNPKVEKAPFFEDGTPSDDVEATKGTSV